MDNNKLENIEVILAHQEQQINELNEVITEQWAQIELLKKRIKKVLLKIERLENSDQINEDGLSSIEKSATERPPHY